MYLFPNHKKGNRVKGETEEEMLKNGADHATQVHGINPDDIYVNGTPVNFLCQIIPKLGDQ